MNRKGMTAFMDSIVFLMVVMAAIAVSISFIVSEDASNDPEDVLTILSKTEVRLSDFTSIDDDSLVYLTDVMAYDLIHDSMVREYLEDILTELYGKHGYKMVYSNDKEVAEIGSLEGYVRYESSIDVKISNGSYLDISLGLW